jgi:hypothetical protein
MNLWNTLGVTPLGGILIAAGGIAAAAALAVARLRRAGSASRLRLGLDR